MVPCLAPRRFSSRATWFNLLQTWQPIVRRHYSSSTSSSSQALSQHKRKRIRKVPAKATYDYRPLPNPRTIRVAILEPAESSRDALRLRLKRISLDSRDRLRYEALSYVWGASAGDQPVFCDGKVLLVTANCESALRHLRLKKRPRVLWIDALCINQSSNSEKSRQVPLMGDIYESATRVLVWLGPGSPEITSVFKRATLLSPFIFSPLYILRSFGPKVGDQVRKWNFLYTVSNWFWHWCYPNSRVDAAALIKVSRNEWFSRMWTVQEHLLAENCVLVSGHNYCSWTAFSSYWIWSLRAIQALKSTFLPASLRIAIWVAFKNAAETRHCGNLSSASFDIFSGFVECARTHRARDPRDKVYAFLPLIQKLEPRTARLPVNYSLSPSRVYEEFARYTIRLSGSLKYLESLPPLRYRSSLPSWVMDLQVPAKFPMRRWAASQLGAKATGSSRVDTQLIEYSRSRELLVRGIEVSDIKILSAPGPMNPKTAEELNKWFFNWIHGVGTSVQNGLLPWAYDSVDSGMEEFIDGAYRFDPFLGGSVLFLTSSGHLGVSNFDLEVGDRVVLLSGCSLPTVLRTSRSQRSKMHFLGVSYIAGMSHGEAWPHRERYTSTSSLDTFVLV